MSVTLASSVRNDAMVSLVCEGKALAVGTGTTETATDESPISGLRKALAGLQCPRG
jgi:hypothetical protein